MGYGGKILPLSKNLERTAKGLVLGGEINFEFQPTGKHQWEQFWNFPTVGIGIAGLDLGNQNILGQAFAVYPYLLVPVVKTDFFRLNYKVGAGISFITKTWNRCDTINGVDAPSANSAIGSIANIYLNTGANFEFQITPEFALTADFGYSHMSNGSILTPNTGINIIYGEIGAKYNFTNCNECKRLVKNPAYELPYDFIATIGISGGSRELYHKDNKSFFVGNVHTGLTAPLTNWYALGGGFDLFYDGAFNKRDFTDISRSFQRYYLPQNRLANKIRLGIAINNEFIIGKVTGIFDFGIYLYNPLKNFENGEDVVKNDKKPFNKGIFYKYNIDREDGWNYFRLGLRYRIWNNFFLSVDVKTHLQKAEMITFGFGYYLPFAQAGKHAVTKKSAGNYYLYHFNQKEATAYPTPWKN
jgi:hypothetical protein